MSDSTAAPNPPSTTAPKREATLIVIPMPRDKNALNKIFGGWLMAQMDLACSSRAMEEAGPGQVLVTRHAEIDFIGPVEVGDKVSFHTDVAKVGNTSITITVEAKARRRLTQIDEHVGDGKFVFVAIDKNNNKTPILKI